MRHIYFLMWAIGLILLVLTTASAKEQPVASFGDLLPDVALPVPVKAVARDYLGLDKEELLFTPSQVKCDLLVIEVLNVHCLHCQVQAPAFNELFKLIEADPVTRGRIKMLGVAIGNLPGEVEKFHKTHSVPFPLIPDPDFVVHRAWGVNATPYAAYIRQGQPGQQGFVVGTEHGLNTDYRRLFAQLQDYLLADIDALHRQSAQAERRRTMILPLYSEDELQRKVRQTLINTGGRVELFKPLELRSGRRVYVASLRVGEERVRLFAEVTSRQSVCDICQDLHFIYLFDTSGRIVGFEPLQVTKYGNVLWNKAEAEQMRRRLIGQYLATPRPFDPELDAVTSATISSAIIFDSISQGKALLEELRTEGLL